MTNATKTLAIIFAGTLALAVATSWGWSSTSSAAFQENLLAVDTSAVQAVHFDRSDGPSIRLEREDGGWRVAPSDTSARYLASTEAVNDLFERLPALQVNTVTTRQSDKHARYGVDSTGTTVTMVGSGDETLGQLIVGRTHVPRPDPKNMSRRQMMQRMRNATPTTYVRLPNKPDVYTIEKSLQSLVNQQVEEWRRKTLWALDRSQIQRIDFTLPGDSSFTMQRAAPSDEGATGSDTWLSAEDTLETSAVSSVLKVLSSPEATGFVKGTTPDTFSGARYTVRLQTTDGARRAIRLRPGDGDHYVAAADGFPYVVKVGKNKWDDSVLQGRTALLKNK